MARNIFDSQLSDVSGVSTPSGSGIGTPPIVKKASSLDGVGDALNILAKWDAGNQVRREKKENAEVETGVDAAIDSAFQSTFGINERNDINASMDRLEALQQAASQGRGTADRFNLSLMAEAKALKTKYPDKAQLINQAFRDRGLIDPRTSILQKQAKIEQDRATFEEEIRQRQITNAVDSGYAVFNEPGNPGSGINREKTFAAINEAQQIQQRQNARNQALGIYKKTTGEYGVTMRPAYLAEQPQLRSDAWNMALLGVRPAVNELQKMLVGADPNNLQAIKEQAARIVQQADTYRLNQRAAVATTLNSEEFKDHMNFVENEVIVPLTQAVLNIQNASDLNQIKAAAHVLQLFNDNFQLMNYRDAPTLTRLTLFNRDVATAMLNGVKLGEGILAPGLSVANRELATVMDLMPPKEKPKDPDMKFDQPETDYGKEDRETRINFGYGQQKNFIDKSIIAERVEDSYAWVKTQTPLYNAFQERKFSPADTKRISDQMLSANYAANLQHAVNHYPENGAKVGAYSFDVVERRLLDIGRELRTTGGGGKLGTEYQFVWNSASNKLEVKSLKPKKDNVQSAIEGIATGVPGGIGIPTFSQDYGNVRALTERLQELNKAIPHLLKTKKFKPNYEGVSDDEFMQATVQFINGMQ